MMKKVLYIMIFAVMIILGIIIAKRASELENMKETNIESNIMVNSIENTVENTSGVENTLGVENEINEVVENTAVNEAKEENNTKQEQTNISNVSNEEKAKAIVKKDWGEDNSVYFEVDKVEVNGDGKFEISVRDKKTTRVLYRYTVDVNTGKFVSEVEAY